MKIVGSGVELRRVSISIGRFNFAINRYFGSFSFHLSVFLFANHLDISSTFA